LTHPSLYPQVFSWLNGHERPGFGGHHVENCEEGHGQRGMCFAGWKRTHVGVDVNIMNAGMSQTSKFLNVNICVREGNKVQPIAVADLAVLTTSYKIL
jgi:hypothetical protein